MEGTSGQESEMSAVVEFSYSERAWASRQRRPRKMWLTALRLERGGLSVSAGQAQQIGTVNPWKEQDTLWTESSGEGATGPIFSVHNKDEMLWTGDKITCNNCSFSTQIPFPLTQSKEYQS